MQIRFQIFKNNISKFYFNIYEFSVVIRKIVNINFKFVFNLAILYFKYQGIFIIIIIYGNIA